MKLWHTIKQKIRKTDATAQLLTQLEEKLSLHSEETQQQIVKCLEASHQVAALQQAQLDLLNQLVQQGRLRDLSDFQTPVEQKTTLKEAVACLPLLLAEKTYNTSHPEYDALLVRNYPGRFFNPNRSIPSEAYRALLPLMTKSKGFVEIKDERWQPILEEVMEEVKRVPYASEVFERKAYIENYAAKISARYQAHYCPGWVNLEDALFLYWLVRKSKPKTVVQTGVCNGLSSAFIMLALAQNGAEGRLYAIDLPAIFDPQDPAWTVENKVYGVFIPEGKSSGWLVPDAYRDRFEVVCGDAKQHLSPLIDRLPSIDLFYHDSDHTYHHMLFEFVQAKRKLKRGGMIVADDISWNASLWDFADQHKAPAYNYKGAVGVAFF